MCSYPGFFSLGSDSPDWDPFFPQICKPRSKLITEVSWVNQRLNQCFPLSTESSSTSAQSVSQPSTTTGTGAAAKTKQDPTRPKGTVVQLKRPGTSATWSNTRGGRQAQRGSPTSGRVRRLRRDPVAGPSHRGRGTQMSRGRGGGTPRGGQTWTIHNQEFYLKFILTVLYRVK